MKLEILAQHLAASGIPAKAWHDGKIFIDGYGRQLKISVTPVNGQRRPLDGAHIHVTSSWKSTKVGLYCKGAKHALLCDLYQAGFVSEPPPEDWRKVVLDDRPKVRAIERYISRDDETPNIAFPAA